MQVIRKYSWLIIFSICFLQVAFAKEKKVYNILAFGAKADGVTNNSGAIQTAVDEAGKNGGGIVVVPAGIFLTGPFQLRPGIELRLEENAILLGSAKRMDYGNGNAYPLISGTGLKDISITGKGTIDGNAKALLDNVFAMLKAGTLQDPEWQTENPWHQKRPTEANRPQLLYLFNCNNIIISGVTFRNATTWVQDYKECNNLVIDKIKVESTSYWNNDGIDVVDCSEVKISDCSVNAADDGICLKSENSEKICKNVLIKHCTVRSSASAIKFGTASRGGFKNVKVEDIDVYDTYRSAIALEAVDGGILDSIFVKNIHARNTGNAIFIKLGHRNKTEAYSKVEHIIIKDVVAQIPSGKPDKGYETEGPVVGYPHNVFPASVSGLPGHPVKDVTLENIQIEYEGGADRNVANYGIDSLERIAENISGYPEFSMFGELPAWGFYIRHVEGFVMKNVTLKTIKSDFRSACIFDDVQKLDIDSLKISGDIKSPVVLLNNVKNHELKNLHLPSQLTGGVKEQ
ncbi:MAG: glycoside hydrolase family 28 [Bacteroidetes bacterium]|nr:glycoside hydrolase family 28 [Bacteroidota bacterium]